MFAFCDIRKFTNTTEVLQENVLRFVNLVRYLSHLLLFWNFTIPICITSQKNYLLFFCVVVNVVILISFLIHARLTLTVMSAEFASFFRSGTLFTQTRNGSKEHRIRT